MAVSEVERQVSAVDVTQTSSTADTGSQQQSLWPRIKILIRRIHLYTGLFLLPWVFLYGVTGAMYNHQGLFPQVTYQSVDDAIVAKTPFAEFPTPEEFAQQIADRLQESADGSTISLAANHGAEFTNNLMFEVNQSGVKHIVNLDPVSKSSYVVNQPQNPEQPEPLLTDIHNIKLEPNPMAKARQAAATVLNETGITANAQPRPYGWSKLNFLANVDGKPARITYVLKDGHVDVTKYVGEDGMTTRHFMMRLHTTHGRSPHWNGRMFWSLAVDTMAIAMVCWGFTGIFMWWQLKRARLIGGTVIAVSLCTAAVMYFSVHDFYAATKM